MKKMVMVVLLVLWFQPDLLARGSEVEIVLISSNRVSGELIPVREGSLLLSMKPRLNDEELTTSDSVLVEVEALAIDSISLKREGGSYSALGALIGCAVGGGAGYALSSEEEKDPVSQALQTAFSPFATVTLALLGTGFGALIGSAIREDKIIALRTDGAGIGSLKEYARFDDEEPEFLRKATVRRIE